MSDQEKAKDGGHPKANAQAGTGNETQELCPVKREEPCADPDGRMRLLRCEKCGASLLTFLTDLLRYTREGWPKCCNLTMAVFVEDRHPLTDPPRETIVAPPEVIEEARELLDRALEGAEQVTANIEKSKEVLGLDSSTVAGRPPGDSDSGE